MKKILLPVDGSKRSIRTVEMVKQLCDPADSDITGGWPVLAWELKTPTVVTTPPTATSPS